MIHCVGVHALDEAEFIGNLSRVGHKATDPRAALTVLRKRLHLREHQFVVRITSHRAEPPTAHILRRNRFAMQLGNQRLPIK